jgi:Cytosine/uracil/thiamine/allantoin permeases
MSALISVIGSYTSLSVSQADFSLIFLRQPSVAYILYVFLFPAMFTLIAFIGIAVSSAGQVKYNTKSIPWDPNVLISFQSNRASQFFRAFSFALAALRSNISANSLAAANDLSALAPQLINIRRGQLLYALFA